MRDIFAALMAGIVVALILSCWTRPGTFEWTLDGTHHTFNLGRTK